MKKLFITFLSGLMMMALCISIYAESNTRDADFERGRFYLETFGVESFNIDYNSHVTRGYAAAAVANILYDELSNIHDSSFYADISADSPYASAAYLLTLNGVMSGDGTNFFPDNPVTYEQTAKIFVSALGRNFIAEQKGGYPSGYVAEAAFMDIFKGIAYNPSDRVTYVDFVKMFYNFTKCKGLNIGGAGFREYYEDECTVLERKMKRCDIVYVEGVVTANQFGTADDDLGRVSIDGVTYYLGCDISSEILGYFVNAFVDIENNEVISIQADPKMNSVKVLTGSDILSIDLDEIKYYENNKPKTIKLSDVSVARNDKALTTFTKEDLVPLNGGIVLIDNDNDKQYEFVCVQNRQYCMVERTSTENNVVVLENGTYESSTHIYINPEDEKFYHRIYKSNGEVAQFSDIKSEDVLKIEGSPDQKVLKVYILNDKFDGVATARRFDDEHILTVNQKEYKIAKNALSEYIIDVENLSFSATYSFTVDGEYIVSVDQLKSNAAYAYVIRAYKDDDDNVGYRIISEDKQLYKGFIADKIVYNGKKISKEKFTPQSNVVIKYRVDSEGKICSIDDAKLHTEKENMVYAQNTGIFYSKTYADPLFVSEDTVIFVIPNSGDEDDYMADCLLVNSTTYKCESYDYDEEALSPGVILIYDDVYYESPGYIYAESPVCIFKEGVQLLDENGEVVRQITWYEGNEEKAAIVKDTANMNRIVSKMAPGDVFQYSVTTRGFVDNIRTLVMLDQNPAYFHTGAYSNLEQAYGKVVDMQFEQLPKGRVAKFVNIFTLNVGEEQNKKFLVTSVDDAVNYYLYNSESKTVKPTTIENVMSEDGVLGTFKASEVFIYYYNREAIAVVIKN